MALVDSSFGLWQGVLKSNDTVRGVFNDQDSTSKVINRDTCLTFIDPDQQKFKGWKKIRAGVKKHYSLSLDSIVRATIRRGNHCEDSTRFMLHVYVDLPGTNFVSFNIPAQSDCKPIFTCGGDDNTGDSTKTYLQKWKDCSTSYHQIVNPYKTNLLNNWHPHKQYKWQGDRQPSTTQTPADPRKSGYFKSFSPFWSWDTTAHHWQPQPTDWIRTNKVTLINPDGQALENIDALNRHDAAGWGYNFQFPVVTADNAKYRQLFYDGFEAYTRATNIHKIGYKCSSFMFSQYKGYISKEHAHTGLHSMQIPYHGQLSFKTPTRLPAHKKSVPQRVPYRMGANDCRGVFTPAGNDTGQVQRYVLSLWIKAVPQPFIQSIKPTEFYNKLAYNKLKTVIKVNNNTVPVRHQYTSPLINQWQQIRYTFRLPTGISGVFKMKLKSRESLDYKDLYIDDIRIHPYQSNMKSYVYHPYTHRIMAILDNNNFATKYQYNARGKLQETLRETERGLQFVNYYKRERQIK